jgi:hypothetical protein
MSRELPATLAQAVESPTVDIFFAVELFFDTSTLRFWSGLGEITLEGETYVGSGQMIQISSVDESLEISAKGATLTLSGLPSDLLSLAIQEPYQGRKCKIYFGLKDNKSQFLTQEGGDYILSETGSFIDISTSEESVMAEIFSGYLDQMNIDEGPDVSTISVYVESRLIDLKRPRIRRYTSESQKSRFPNDRGFDFVEDLQMKKFTWGR